MYNPKFVLLFYYFLSLFLQIISDNMKTIRRSPIIPNVGCNSVRLDSRILVHANELREETPCYSISKSYAARLEIARVDIRGVAARRQGKIGGVLQRQKRRRPYALYVRTWVVACRSRQIVGVQFRRKTTSS